MSSKNPNRTAPYVAALLRLTYQVARERQLEVQVRRGFSDLNQALLSVLVYPPPDGVRPSDLAERTNMTKQAINYLVGQLERLGYMERKAVNGRRRLIYLTKRGWDVFDTQWTAMRQLEEEWAKRVGKKRFDDFLSVLRELSGTADRHRR
jgi:DNA-binding MarR family transcriptional regulator